MSIKMVLQKGWAGVQGYVTAPGHYSSDHPVIRSSLNFFHFPMPPGGWGHQNNLSLVIVALSPLWCKTGTYLWVPECTVYLPSFVTIYNKWTLSCAHSEDLHIDEWLSLGSGNYGHSTRHRAGRPPPSQYATTRTTIKMTNITTSITIKIAPIMVSCNHRDHYENGNHHHQEHHNQDSSHQDIFDSMHKAEGYDIGFIQVSQLSIWSAVKPEN